MKTWLTILTLAVCSHTAIFAKKHTPIEKGTEQHIMTVQEFSEQIAQGMEIDRFKDLILECPAGTILPIRLTLRGDVLTFDSGNTLPINIKIVQTIYLKNHGKGHLFSHDLQKWEHFEDFFIGKGGAALIFNDHMPTASLELEINQKKNRWEVNFGSFPFCKRVYSHHVEYLPYPVYQWNMEQIPTSETPIPSSIDVIERKPRWNWFDR